MNPAIEQVLSNPNLPTLPTVAMEVLDLTSRPDVNLREIERAIERDQAMTARVLRTINSSFYGLSRRCGSIRQAVAFLGLDTVKSLVLGFSLVKVADGGGCDEVSFDFINYWRRSFLCASSARVFANAVRGSFKVDPDEAFVAALVQDVGMVTMWRVHGDRYLQILDMVGSSQNGIIQAERRHFDVDHAQIGSEMTRRWRFPDTIVSAIGSHHQSCSTMISAEPLAKVIRISVTAAAMIDPDHDRKPDAMRRFERQVVSWFDIPPASVHELLVESATLAREMIENLDLVGRNTPSVDEILVLADEARSNLPDILPVDIDDTSTDTDEITGLPGRTSLIADLESTFRESGPRDITGLLLIGIDEIRFLNESIGDSAGDSALRHVAGCIEQVVASGGRDTSSAYRFVGAEMAVMVNEVDEDEIFSIAESIRDLVGRRPLRVDSRDGHSDFCSIHVTIGVGIQRFDERTTGSPDGLLREAMCAVTSGRRDGGDRVEFHPETDGTETDLIDVA